MSGASKVDFNMKRLLVLFIAGVHFLGAMDESSGGTYMQMTGPNARAVADQRVQAVAKTQATWLNLRTVGTIITCVFCLPCMFVCNGCKRAPVTPTS